MSSTAILTARTQAAAVARRPAGKTALNVFQSLRRYPTYVARV